MYVCMYVGMQVCMYSMYVCMYVCAFFFFLVFGLLSSGFFSPLVNADKKKNEFNFVNGDRMACLILKEVSSW